MPLQTWTLADPLPSARSGVVLVAMDDGHAVLVGGYDGVDFLQDCYCWSYNTKTWLRLDNLPIPIAFHHAVKLVNGDLLLVGGFTTGFVVSDAAFILNKTTLTWTQVSSMSTARFAGVLVVLADGRVLVSGGNDGASALHTAEIYDVDMDSWSAATTMSNRRQGALATLLNNGKVIVIGGTGAPVVGVHVSTSSAELYDPIGDSWSIQDVPINPADGVSIILLNHAIATLPSGKIIVAGGGALPGSLPTSAVEIYNPTLDSWAVGTDMAFARDSHFMFATPTGALVAGGYLPAYAGGALTAEEYVEVGPLWQAANVVNNSHIRNGGITGPNSVALLNLADTVFLVTAEEDTADGGVFTAVTEYNVWDNAGAGTGDGGECGLSAPTLISPPNGSVMVALNPTTFTWGSVFGAATYQIQVATDAAFTDIIFDESGIAALTKNTFGLYANVVLYWRVKAFS